VKRNKKRKKIIVVVGRLIFPLKIGAPAFIRKHGGEYAATAPVQSVFWDSLFLVKFETDDAVYQLLPRPAISCVLQADMPLCA
jgi:hypothetical protein